MGEIYYKIRELVCQAGKEKKALTLHYGGNELLMCMNFKFGC